MSFTPSASFAQTVTFASLVRRGRLYVGPVFPINTRSFETSRQIVTISGGHMPLRADTRHYGRTQGPPLRTYLVSWRHLCHLFHSGRHLLFRADTRSAPTHVLGALTPLVTFASLVLFTQTVTFAPLVRRGRLYVGPVFPINTRSFETFGQIVIISGGHMPLRADTRHYGRT